MYLYNARPRPPPHLYTKEHLHTRTNSPSQQGNAPACTYLAVEAQHEQHEEEEHGPERGDRQLHHGTRVRQKRQART